MGDSHRPMIELCVRSLGRSPSYEYREQVIERLQELKEEGSIADFSISIYGDGVIPRSDSVRTATGVKLCHRILLLRQWASINDGDYRHFFALRDSAEMGGQITPALVFPPMLLLEYDSTRLSFATPFEKAQRRYTIDEHLESLGSDPSTVLPARQTSTTIEDPQRTGARNLREISLADSEPLRARK